MKLKHLLLSILTIFISLTGCSHNESSANETAESFSDKEEATRHFLQENPKSDIEYIQTTEDDDLFIERSGNHQYRVHGMKKENEEFSVVKLTASLSLHNSNAGSGEFTSSDRNEYTFLIVKKGSLDELNADTRNTYTVSPIYSGDAELSLTKNDDLKSPANVIQTSEMIADSNSSASKE
ncbi:hypothetical protein LF817_14515 [Halobacillus sp. A1]|uniref:hypothetical protein n=1 Tax=Halobacillus sp. A1 TaxID=2880262 RepID=UPI0020A63C33|nr:hypothetical protein [Halobacillus sp. A1]MCP3032538.1 hypothetical protein [Halobacillus sp. A1]